MDTRYYTKDIALVRQANINLPNIKLFSSDYLKTTQDKVVKHFHLYTHPEIYKIISNNKHNYLYENYEANDPIKLFIDIDYKINNDSDNTTIDLLINTTIDFLNNILSDYGYINTPIIVLNASTDIKLSSHIIFPRIIFQNVYLIANFFKQINDHENIKIIDTLVYRTGCFRMLNCSKLNKNNALRFYKSYNYQYTTDEQLFMDCLLLNIDPKIKFIDYDLIEPPKIIKQKIKINSIDSSRKNLLLLKPKNDHTFRSYTVIDDISDSEIINILNLLPNDYLDNYDKWLVVLNVLKNMNKFDLFDNWSKKSSNYCQTNNLILYNDTKNMFININYLIYIININTDYKLTYFKTTKIYESLTYNINKKLGNDKFVSNILTYQDFCNNDNIIIDSDTGTGKTFCISLFFNRYSKEFPDTKIICISALTSLVRQHIKTFNDHGNNMKSYDGHFDLDDNIAICINSLMKLNFITDELLSNTILYIDEISSFLLLTHNKTLDDILKPVYSLLIRMVKKCKKLVVSDALINDQCIDFSKIKSNDIIFIKNNYKKYQDIKAIKIKHKNTLINKLINKCKNNDHFIFASDSRTKATDFYNICLSNFPDIANQFILITKDTKIKTVNASEEWKDKYVFYSPSIVYGVDFSIDTKQDVFLYITGKTLSPPLLFQQSTRCRNINNLYYFVEKNNTHSAKYESIEKCKDMYTAFINSNNNLNSICKIMNENDDLVLCRNSFFNIFIKNEYMFDTYNTDKIFFFEDMLINKGFLFEELNDDINLNIIISDNKNNINEDYFNSFIENYQNELNNKDPIYKKIQLLGLPFDNDILKKYDKIIYDNNKFTEHLNIIRFMKTDKYIDKKLKDCVDNSYDAKYIKNIYNKIKLLRGLMTKFNIDFFNITYKKPDMTLIDISDSDWLLYQEIFRTRKTKPLTFYELVIAIVGFIKNITFNEIINQYVIQINKKKFVYYTFNFDSFKYHLELHSFSNQKYDYIIDKIGRHVNINLNIDDFI